MEQDPKFQRNYDNEKSNNKFRENSSNNYSSSKNHNGNYQNYNNQRSNKKRRAVWQGRKKNDDDILKLDPLEKCVSGNRQNNWKNKRQKLNKGNTKNNNNNNSKADNSTSNINDNRSHYSLQFRINELQDRCIEKDITIKNKDLALLNKDEIIAELKFKHERELLEFERNYDRKILEIRQEKNDIVEQHDKEITKLKGHMDNKRAIIMKLREQLENANREILVTRTILETTNLRNIELNKKINELTGEKKVIKYNKRIQTDTEISSNSKTDQVSESLNHSMISTMSPPTVTITSTSTETLSKNSKPQLSNSQSQRRPPIYRLNRNDSLDSLGSYARSESYNSQISSETNPVSENYMRSIFDHCSEASSSIQTKTNDLRKLIYMNSPQNPKNQNFTINIDGTKSEDYVMVDYIESPDEMPIKSETILNRFEDLQKTDEKLKSQTKQSINSSKCINDNIDISIESRRAFLTDKAKQIEGDRRVPVEDTEMSSRILNFSCNDISTEEYETANEGVRRQDDTLKTTDKRYSPKETISSDINMSNTDKSSTKSNKRSRINSKENSEDRLEFNTNSIKAKTTSPYTQSKRIKMDSDNNLDKPRSILTTNRNSDVISSYQNSDKNFRSSAEKLIASAELLLSGASDVNSYDSLTSCAGKSTTFGKNIKKSERNIRSSNTRNSTKDTMNFIQNIKNSTKYSNEVFKSPQSSHFSPEKHNNEKIIAKLRENLESTSNPLLSGSEELNRISSEIEDPQRVMSVLHRRSINSSKESLNSFDEHVSISSELQDILQLSTEIDNSDDLLPPIAPISSEKFKELAKKVREKVEMNKKQKALRKSLHIPIIPCYSNNRVISNEMRDGSVVSNEKSPNKMAEINAQSNNQTDKNFDKNNHENDRQVSSNKSETRMLAADLSKQENDVEITSEIFESQIIINRESNIMNNSTNIYADQLSIESKKCNKLLVYKHVTDKNAVIQNCNNFDSEIRECRDQDKVDGFDVNDKELPMSVVMNVEFVEYSSENLLCEVRSDTENDEKEEETNALDLSNEKNVLNIDNSYEIQDNIRSSNDSTVFDDRSYSGCIKVKDHDENSTEGSKIIEKKSTSSNESPQNGGISEKNLQISENARSVPSSDEQSEIEEPDDLVEKMMEKLMGSPQDDNSQKMMTESEEDSARNDPSNLEIQDNLQNLENTKNDNKMINKSPEKNEISKVNSINDEHQMTEINDKINAPIQQHSKTTETTVLDNSTHSNLNDLFTAKNNFDSMTSDECSVSNQDNQQKSNSPITHKCLSNNDITEKYEACDDGSERIAQGLQKNEENLKCVEEKSKFMEVNVENENSNTTEILENRESAQNPLEFSSIDDYLCNISIKSEDCTSNVTEVSNESFDEEPNSPEYPEDDTEISEELSEEIPEKSLETPRKSKVSKSLTTSDSTPKLTDVSSNPLKINVESETMSDALTTLSFQASSSVLKNYLNLLQLDQNSNQDSLNLNQKPLNTNHSSSNSTQSPPKSDNLNQNLSKVDDKSQNFLKNSQYSIRNLLNLGSNSQPINQNSSDSTQNSSTTTQSIQISANQLETPATAKNNSNSQPILTNFSENLEKIQQSPPNSINESPNSSNIQPIQISPIVSEDMYQNSINWHLDSSSLAHNLQKLSSFTSQRQNKETFGENSINLGQNLANVTQPSTTLKESPINLRINFINSKEPCQDPSNSSNLGLSFKFTSNSSINSPEIIQCSASTTSIPTTMNLLGQIAQSSNETSPTSITISPNTIEVSSHSRQSPSNVRQISPSLGKMSSNLEPVSTSTVQLSTNVGQFSPNFSKISPNHNQTLSNTNKNQVSVDESLASPRMQRITSNVGPKSPVMSQISPNIRQNSPNISRQSLSSSQNSPNSRKTMSVNSRTLSNPSDLSENLIVSPIPAQSTMDSTTRKPPENSSNLNLQNQKIQMNPSKQVHIISNETISSKNYLNSSSLAQNSSSLQKAHQLPANQTQVTTTLWQTTRTVSQLSNSSTNVHRQYQIHQTYLQRYQEFLSTCLAEKMISAQHPANVSKTVSKPKAAYKKRSVKRKKPVSISQSVSTQKSVGAHQSVKHQQSISTIHPASTLQNMSIEERQKIIEEEGLKLQEMRKTYNQRRASGKIMKRRESTFLTPEMYVRKKETSEVENVQEKQKEEVPSLFDKLKNEDKITKAPDMPDLTSAMTSTRPENQVPLNQSRDGVCKTSTNSVDSEWRIASKPQSNVVQVQVMGEDFHYTIPIGSNVTPVQMKENSESTIQSPKQPSIAIHSKPTGGIQIRPILELTSSLKSDDATTTESCSTYYQPGSIQSAFAQLVDSIIPLKGCDDDSDDEIDQIPTKSSPKHSIKDDILPEKRSERPKTPLRTNSEKISQHGTSSQKLTIGRMAVIQRPSLKNLKSNENSTDCQTLRDIKIEEEDKHVEIESVKEVAENSTIQSKSIESQEQSKSNLVSESLTESLPENCSNQLQANEEEVLLVRSEKISTKKHESQQKSHIHPPKGAKTNDSQQKLDKNPPLSKELIKTGKVQVRENSIWSNPSQATTPNPTKPLPAHIWAISQPSQDDNLKQQVEQKITTLGSRQSSKKQTDESKSPFDMLKNQIKQLQSPRYEPKSPKRDGIEDLKKYREHSRRESPKKMESPSSKSSPMKEGLLEMGVCSQIVASSLRKSQQARENSSSSDERCIKSFQGYSSNDQHRRSRHDDEGTSSSQRKIDKSRRNSIQCESPHKTSRSDAKSPSIRDKKPISRSSSFNTSSGHQNMPKSPSYHRLMSTQEHMHRRNSRDSPKYHKSSHRRYSSRSPSPLPSTNEPNSKRNQYKSDISQMVITELTVFYELKKFESDNPRELFKAMARKITYHFYDKNPDTLPSRNTIKNYIMEIFYNYGTIKSEKDFLLTEDYV